MEIAPSHCNIYIETTTRRGYFHSNIDSRVYKGEHNDKR